MLKKSSGKGKNSGKVREICQSDNEGTMHLHKIIQGGHATGKTEFG